MLTSANYGQNYDWLKSMIILNHTWLELLEMSMCVNCFYMIYLIFIWASVSAMQDKYANNYLKYNK